ncbi:MAG TPA: hypothetical protein VFW98_18565 [Gemmatimonadaceae bacterium]|nr:hypothetical protein [Gemmatimonadaceae bacterium]
MMSLSLAALLLAVASTIATHGHVHQGIPACALDSVQRVAVPASPVMPADSAVPENVADSGDVMASGSAGGEVEAGAITPPDSSVTGALAALPGSLLPGCRIIAYYGNPFSKRMGILGEIPPDSMLARLQRQAAAYAAADSTVPVVPALDLIVTVAQAAPGRDGMYRLRMPDTLIDRVAGWADRANALLILDVQVGKSTVAAEVQPLLPYLRRPNVHLALDPEFSMKRGHAPGRAIGTMDASDVNTAIDMLSHLVDSLHLPPKLLIVHRFTKPMLTHRAQIHRDPRVQVVIDMDGFGPPSLKRSSYRHYVRDEPVEFAGFKLFYKNDRPLLTPEQVLRLKPVPLFILYQ